MYRIVGITTSLSSVCYCDAHSATVGFGGKEAEGSGILNACRNHFLSDLIWCQAFWHRITLSCFRTKILKCPVILYVVSSIFCCKLQGMLMSSRCQCVWTPWESHWSEAFETKTVQPYRTGWQHFCVMLQYSSREVIFCLINLGVAKGCILPIFLYGYFFKLCFSIGVARSCQILLL